MMIRKKEIIILNNYMAICFRMLICRKTGCGKTNTVLYMLIKPLIYYDKIYLYSKNLEQEKIYTHLSKILERIAKVNKIQIDEIFHSSNEEIKPISEMEDRNQKVVISDDYVCEKFVCVEVLRPSQQLRSSMCKSMTRVHIVSSLTSCRLQRGQLYCYICFLPRRTPR